MKKIAVFIMVYEKPKRTSDIIKNMIACRYPDKEIVVVIDGDYTAEIADALTPVEKEITLLHSGQRIGKAESLNNAVNRTDADTLLFFDNDILLPNDPLFLDKLSEKMDHFDIVEMPKEAIVNSFISNMMSYEFLIFAMTSFTMSFFSGKSLGLNGAAFAVRKEFFQKLNGFKKVINEDADFGARAFRAKAKFCFDSGLKVKNDVPSTLKVWLIQRKRWALNYMLWFRDNLLLVLTSFFRMPSMIIPFLLLQLPLISTIFVIVSLNTFRSKVIIPLFFMQIQQLNDFGGVSLWFFLYQFIFSTGLLPALVGLLVEGIIYFIFARILQFRFNGFWFFIFYFVYSPLWLAANILAGILMLLKINIRQDWKV